jgi:carbon monoxide dehydrogenase subunit G
MGFARSGASKSPGEFLVTACVSRAGVGYTQFMPTVSRTFSVTTPPDRVIDYLKDFGNAEDWDPGTQTCTRQGNGPIDVGTTWHNVSKIVGVKAELTYTLNTLSNRTLVFVGKNNSATSVDTITVDASGAGSVITYKADLEMKGAAKLLNPAMKIVFEKLAGDTEKQMTTVLNGL